MIYYAGIDLHYTNLFLCIINGEGQRVLGERLPLDLRLILATLEPFRAGTRGIAVEATSNWYWLVDGLRDADYPVHLVNTAAARQYEGLKYRDDRSDARWLAEMQRHQTIQ